MLVLSSYCSLYVQKVVHTYCDMFYILGLAQRRIYGMSVSCILLC